MDWLVKYVTTRNTIALLAVAGLLRLSGMYYSYPLYWLKVRLYPPQGPAPAAGRDILEDVEHREATRVEARYRRVLAELEQSRQRGHEVSGLERKARAAMHLNVAAYRRQAIRILAEVEMAVPRPRSGGLSVAPKATPGEEVQPDAPGQPTEIGPPVREKRSRR